MNLFRAEVFIGIVGMMQLTEDALTARRHFGAPQHKAPGPVDHQQAELAIKAAERECEMLGLSESATQIRLARPYISDTSKPSSELLEAHLTRIRETLIDELRRRKFLYVLNDRVEYLDRDDLFGGEVCRAFASACADIKEAGNCFAAECTTACVFHLMRVAEVGLRALARDRQIEFPDKPIEQKEWGQILPKLESVVKKLREDDSTAWKSQAVRETQIRFYNEVIQELRTFNEAWRRHVSHADRNAFYDRNAAASVMEHVKKFMQKLATKISEDGRTPPYWESA